MKNDETISEMFTTFTNIINGLKSLGEPYTNAENVRKILRLLPKNWEAKVTENYIYVFVLPNSLAMTLESFSHFQR